MLSQSFIDHVMRDICIDDITEIKGFWEAYNDDLPSHLHVCHHKYGILLNKTAKELKELGLYEHRPACELQILTDSEHTSLHQTEDRKIYLSELFSGENNPMHGKNSEDYMTEEAVLLKRQHMRESSANYWSTNEAHEKCKEERNQRYIDHPEIKDKISTSLVETWKDQNLRDRQSKKQKESYKNNPERALNHSNKMIEYFNDPIHRLEKSNQNKGENNPMYGKLGTDNPNYGKHCYNNGIIGIRAFECPEGFVPGKLKKNKT